MNAPGRSIRHGAAPVTEHSSPDSPITAEQQSVPDSPATLPHPAPPHCPHANAQHAPESSIPGNPLLSHVEFEPAAATAEREHSQTGGERTEIIYYSSGSRLQPPISVWNVSGRRAQFSSPKK